VAHLIRDVVSDAIANRLSDPRVSRFTSVTRVELSADLRVADVYVSVMGSEIDGRTTMKGLESARGLIQTRLARRLEMRQCPLLRLHLDLGLKVAARTIETLDRLAAESHGIPPGPGPSEDPPSGAGRNGLPSLPGEAP
jgi:ribosome-binding factor A